MNKSKFSDFGVAVKTKLLMEGKEQKWLEQAVTEKTGLYVDGGYLYKILTGRRKAPKIVEAIKDILGLERAESDEAEERPACPAD